MKSEKKPIEIINSPENVTKEPTAEILGSFTEMSRAKNGGSDSSPTKRNS